MRDEDYEKICFVIMPFGSKPVGDRAVDFDRIYQGIFVPAIEAAPLPEGGNLIPRRTDKDFFSGDIGLEMFSYLEYSRFALADITGLNVNVFYELGVRHRTRESGTAVFRQTGASIPFDIRSIKAFDYDYEPEDKVAESRALITNVLTASLERNRLDSPVAIALRAQREGGADVKILLEAENAVRKMDPTAATALYRQAIATDPANALLRMKLGVFLKEQGDWRGALEQFEVALSRSPDFAEAWREKGIAQNKIAGKQAGLAGAGEDALRRATELNPRDYDAWASLGGILKRQGRLEEALRAYKEATRVSRGHAYPLLNELKLEGRTAGRLDLDPVRVLQLKRAELARRRQTLDDPPTDCPWCFFDLSEIELYLGKKTEALETLSQGLIQCTARWQAQTHRDSLELLAAGGVPLDGLNDAIALLRGAEEALPEG